MNLHKKASKGTFELTLRHGMKSWLNRQYPPADIRTKLLQTASGETTSRGAWFSHLVTLSWNHEYTPLSFERFAKATAYSLQIGVLIV